MLLDRVQAILARQEYIDKAKALGLTDLKVLMPTAQSVINSGWETYVQFQWKDTTLDERLYRNQTLTASVPTAAFFGCCGVNIIHHISVPYVRQRRGIGRFLFGVVLLAYHEPAQMRGGGPGLILATTIPVQEGGEALCRYYGFRKHKQFRNPNTHQTVTVWALDISKPIRGIHTKVRPRKAVAPAIAA